MTHDPGGHAVELEVLVEAPADRAFQVFVEEIGAWWPRHMRLGKAERTDTTIEAGVGGRWYERTADGQESLWGRVLAWEPSRRLVLSWQIGVGFVPEPDPDRASRIEVVFTGTGPKQTSVTLVHRDFERHGEGWESMRAGVAHEGAWPAILQAYAQLAGGRSSSIRA